MQREKNDTLTFLFWANFAAFTLHVIDETVMAGGLVAFVQRHFWAGFRIGDFAVANGVWLIAIAIANILYDWQGGRVAAVPMAFLWERCLNAVFHVGSTIWFKEYSPGLATGLLFFVILYLICRYGLLRGHIRASAFYGAVRSRHSCSNQPLFLRCGGPTD